MGLGRLSLLRLASSPRDTDDDDEENTTDSDADWRKFRASLVRSENGSSSTSSSTDQTNNLVDESESYVYDANGLVERGSIILSVPSTDPLSDDADALTNQCYRKSVVLVLEAKSDFMSGIVLNRPTNIDLAFSKGSREERRFVRRGAAMRNEDGSFGGQEDREEDANRWKLWFGGEVGGPYSEEPQVMCLHSITTDFAKEVSDIVLPGVMITSHEGARAIVDAGDASPSDFWTFCGICGWETSSFQREMKRENMWSVVCSDGRTLFKELGRLRCDEENADTSCDVDADPRNAGLHTWEMLMDLVGRGEDVRRRRMFGDLMLREWATGVLSFNDGDERNAYDGRREDERRAMPPMPMQDNNQKDEDEDDFDIFSYDPASGMADASSMMSTPQMPNRKDADTAEVPFEPPNMVGSFVRASSAPCPPFLLSDQVFHRSTILILRDDDVRTEGVVLNHVTKESVALMSDNDSDDGKVVEMDVRYGGPYLSVSDVEQDSEEPSTIYLHYDDVLREAGIGSPIGPSGGVCICTEEEVARCVRKRISSPSKFMAMRGIANWEKGASSPEEGIGPMGGIWGDIEEGFFEVVEERDSKAMWDMLLSQERLSSETIDRNVAASLQAWRLGSWDSRDEEKYAGGGGGAGRNSSKSESPMVFCSDVQVLDLAAEALRRWAAVFLLGEAVDGSSSIF